MTPRRITPASRSATAFTLVELLVVVAIIALLISILLPSLRAAREQGKQTVCLANLRSMGQAMVFYADENRDYVARGEWLGSPIPWATHFAATLLPGLGYDGKYGVPRTLWRPGAATYRRPLLNACRENVLFQCPSYPDPDQALDYVVNGINISLYPVEVIEPGQPPDGSDLTEQTPEWVPLFTRRMKLESFVPATLVYVTEANARVPTELNHRDGPWGHYHDMFSTRHLSFGNNPRMMNDDRHPGGSGTMFFDGHADRLGVNTLDPGWPTPLDLRVRLFTRLPPE